MCDSGDDSTRSDVSTVFCRPTALERLSVPPRGCADLNRLYVLISKLCLELLHVISSQVSLGCPILSLRLAASLLAPIADGTHRLWKLRQVRITFVLV